MQRVLNGVQVRVGYRENGSKASICEYLRMKPTILRCQKVTQLGRHETPMTSLRCHWS